MFGVSAALTTPVDRNGTICLERLNNHINTVLSEGCSSVTFFGTTGEGASVPKTGRLAALKAAIEAGICPSKIILTVHGAAAGDIVDQVQEALEMEIRRFLLPPPCYYNAPMENGLFDWFSSVLTPFNETPAEFILYHIPQVIGVGIPVALVSRLKMDFPANVYGVKDSSGSFENTKKLLKLPDLKILVGDERLLAASVRLGAAGAISGIANVFANRLDRVVLDGKEDRELDSLVDTILKFPVTPAIKALVSRRYNMADWRQTLAPLQPVSDAEFSVLAAVYDKVARLS